VWLASIALRGRFIRRDESLFSKRYHQKNAHRDIRSRVAWLRPDDNGYFSLPYWQELFGCSREFLIAPIPAGAELRCARSVVGWTATYAANLANDLALAVQTGLGLRRLNDPDQQNWEGS
jgi:hypothetical protein